MTCYVGKGMGGTKYLYYRCEYCKILLPEKRITDEYLSDLNMLLQEDEMAEVSFTEMEFSEKRTTNSISKKFLYKFLTQKYCAQTAHKVSVFFTLRHFVLRSVRRTMLN